MSPQLKETQGLPTGMKPVPTSLWLQCLWEITPERGQDHRLGGHGLLWAERKKGQDVDSGGQSLSGGG